MALKFYCSCGQKLAVKEDQAGRKIRCPRCKQVALAPQALLPHSEITEAVEDDIPTKPMPKAD